MGLERGPSPSALTTSAETSEGVEEPTEEMRDFDSKNMGGFIEGIMPSSDTGGGRAPCTMGRCKELLPTRVANEIARNRRPQLHTVRVPSQSADTRMDNHIFLRTLTPSSLNCTILHTHERPTIRVGKPFCMSH